MKLKTPHSINHKKRLWSTPLAIFMLFQSALVYAQQSKGDSLQKHFIALLNTEQTDSALVVLEELIAARKAENDDYEWVRALHFKGEILRRTEDFEKALDAFNLAKEEAKELAPSTVKSAYYNRRAALLYEMDSLSAALQDVHRSQKIDSLASLKWQKLSNLNLEGAILRDLGRDKEAIAVLKQHNKEAKINANEHEYLMSCFNLLILYSKLGEHEKAVEYGKKYIYHKPNLSDKTELITVLDQVTYSYDSLGMIDSAYAYLKRAEKESSEKIESLAEKRIQDNRLKSALQVEKLNNELLASKNKRNELQLLLLLAATLIILAIFIIVLKQRAHFKRLNEKKEELNRELGQSLTFKNRLLSIVAHDIKNPMNGVVSIIQLFREGALDKDKFNHYLERLERSATQVNLLLENLLNWVKIQGKDFSLKSEEIDIREIVDRVLAETENLVELKGIVIKTDIEEVSKWIEADDNALSLILRNLLTNSLKFSHDGDEIKIRSQQLKNGDLLIAVQDYGTGISASQLEKLKTQSLNSQKGTDNERGTGLGLTLCREMAERLNADLEIESEEGKGTTVSLRFKKIDKS